MKLPSIQYLSSNAKNAFLRFPLTLISSLIAVLIGIYLTENEKYIPNVFPFINVLLCLALAVPLYFCAKVLREKKALARKTSGILALLSTTLLLCIYFTLPGSESTHNTSLPYVKYSIYNATVHLLVSFLPFIFSNQLNGFWQYNKALFLRFLTAVLYSGVLYLGLALALAALNLLFDIKIHDKLYFELFIVIGGFMNTWFFVSGIPKDIEQLNDVTEYPKGLKIFAQYILLPLLALYLVILYFYGGKILWIWDWPKGIVSYLIVCISVLGIFTFLLLHPYGTLEGNKWIRTLSKAYYICLFPLLVILFIAIFMRVNDYGITISRYSIVLLGLWLVLVCTYVAVGKVNIKFIPSSLAVMLVLMSFGPWGMFSYSEKSQMNRLKEILRNSKLLQSEMIAQEVEWVKDSLPRLYSSKENCNEKVLNDSLHNEVRSILRYLDTHHGFTSIRTWFKQNIDSILTAVNSKKSKWEQIDEADMYMRSMGLTPHEISKWAEDDFQYNAQFLTMLEVSGYDYVIDFNHYQYNKEHKLCSFALDSVDYTLEYAFKPNADMYLTTKTKSVKVDFKNFMENLVKKYHLESQYGIPLADMHLSVMRDECEVKIEFQSIGLERKSKHAEVNAMSGKLFIKLRTTTKE